MVPVGVVEMFILRTHVVVKRSEEEHKTLKVGSFMYITETGTRLGRVDGYWRHVTKPDYSVKLDPYIKVPIGTHVSFVEEFAQHIDEEDLLKRFHEPGNKDFHLVVEIEYYHKASRAAERGMSVEEVEQEEEEINKSKKKRVLDSQLQYQHFRSNQSTEPNRGKQPFQDQSFGMQQEPYPNAEDPMMYQPQQQNQIGVIPNVVPKLAMMMIMDDVMMHLQEYLNSQMSKIQEDGGLGSLIVYENYSNEQQHFDSPMNIQQLSPNEAACPDPYANYYLSQAKDLFLKFKTSQQFAFQNQQTHPPMQFNAGPSSYRGRGGWRGHRGRDRGRGRRGPE